MNKLNYILILFLVAVVTTGFIFLSPKETPAVTSAIYFDAATSGTIQIPSTGTDIIMIHEAGLTLAMTFAMPTNPVDGQSVTICSVGGITAISMTGTVGTILNGLGGLISGGTGTYIYSLNKNKWYRIK